jgi:cytochrome c oxidase subunit 3
MAVVDTASVEERPAEEHHKPGGISSSLLGMVLFIASEVMFFGGLFGAYFTIRGSATEWPPAGTEAHLETWYAAVLTTILVTSSVTMQLGVWAIRKNDQRRLKLWLVASLLLGVTFLCGQAFEYAKLISEGMTLSSGVFGSTFYTLTGFHGAHVAGGAAFILIVFLRARSGQFTARYHDTVEMASYYWHFVDVVWLGLFSTIYLLR